MSKQPDNRIIRQEVSDQPQSIELTDVNPGGAKLTDAELDAVTGGGTNMGAAKHDMQKGLIQNFRV
jgi:hypothetical protein